MNSENNIIEVSNIAVSFGKKKILNNISFIISKGQMIGITGENGSGKSTFLKILVGILKPDSGKVNILGKLGYCPQEQLIFDNLTVSENFAYFSKAYGMNGNNYEMFEKNKKKLMHRFRFLQYENMLVSSLSGGTKQKLNLAISLLHEPQILLLDEPYSGFEWETYLHFWSYAEELREKGVNIMIVSHFIYDRTNFDKIFELREGRISCS